MSYLRLCDAGWLLIHSFLIQLTSPPFIGPIQEKNGTNCSGLSLSSSQKMYFFLVSGGRTETDTQMIAI
jgi:hypothetical protein